MIDRITLKLSNDIETNLKILSNPLFTLKHRGDNNFTGNYRNLSIKKRGSYLYVEGSITKFGYRGTNALNADMYMTAIFIQALIDEIGVNPRSIITSIEVGFNIPVAYEAEMYIRDLSSANGYKGIIIYGANYKVFYQGKEQIRFYDKNKDFKKAKHLKDVYMPYDINLLRYEIRIYNPYKKLNMNSPLMVDQLLDKSIISRLVSLWASEFGNINKQYILHENINPVTPSDVIDYLTVKGLNTFNSFSCFLNQSGIVQFDRNQHQNKKRVRDMLGEILKKGTLVKPTSLMKELEDKILFTAMHFLVGN